jgi:hypothetical protein
MLEFCFQRGLDTRNPNGVFLGMFIYSEHLSSSWAIIRSLTGRAHNNAQR